jgi:amidophosphoribosyltransferase
MCGFIGMMDSEAVAGRISTGLQTLQHRGQDSCGLFTFDGGRFPGHRGLGLVRDVFSREVIEGLPGGAGVGHVRYPTIGRGVLADAQPFFERRPGVIMAHNGNLTNYTRLRERLMERSIHLLSNCDVEPMLCVFAEELMARRRRSHTVHDVVSALRATYGIVEGAYSAAMVLEIDGEPTMVAFRDPRGIRPGVWGRRGDGFIVSSESVAIDALGFQQMGDLEPGKAMFFRPGQEPIVHDIEAATPSPCVFEAIYFSRPDSVEGGQTVYARRLELGRRLAQRWQEKGFEVDRVIPVPDTSRPAAIAFAEEVELPCREGFIKNRYSGRTFIMGDQATRENALRLKLNLIRSEFEGQRVVIIDDSIVRGSTVRRLLDLVWAQGPRSVHLAIHAPPVLNPCFYGIDMSTKEELAARRYVGDEVDGQLEGDLLVELEELWAKDLGVDSLTFLAVSDLDGVFPKDRCAACFDGVYPLPIPPEQREEIQQDRTCGRLRPVSA